MDNLQEFDSTWKWVTWAVMILLFLMYDHYRRQLKDFLYPKIVTDRGRRQVYDLTTFLGGVIVFLMTWGYILEWIYNG